MHWAVLWSALRDLFYTVPHFKWWPITLYIFSLVMTTSIPADKHSTQREFMSLERAVIIPSFVWKIWAKLVRCHVITLLPWKIHCSDGIASLLTEFVVWKTVSCSALPFSFSCLSASPDRTYDISHVHCPPKVWKHPWQSVVLDDISINPYHFLVQILYIKVTWHYYWRPAIIIFILIT